MSQTTKELGSNETVLWQGKPVRALYILPHSIATTLFGLLFMAVPIIFFVLLGTIEIPFLIMFFIGFAIALAEPIAMVRATKTRNT